MQPQFFVLRRALLLAAATLLLSACATRSISNSGYQDDSGWGYWHAPSNPLYRGELTEFDVLGIDPATPPTEAQIQAALTEKAHLTVAKGSSVLLIQSGAMIPDEEMVRGLEKYFNVSVFSGVPVTSQSRDKAGKEVTPYAPALRLAAARGGHEKLLVYWGMLESAQQNLATRAVSWVPFVGGVVPDKEQQMRIRLKVAVIDVRSGQWDMFSPAPYADHDISGRYNREVSDQTQVALLKSRAYGAAVEDLVKRYTR